MTPHVTSPPQRGSPSPIFTQPRPRPPKSAAELDKIRLRNRRREWLGRNPRYLDDEEHEFAAPLLYDALIRRFQTPSERQDDVKTKGYSRVLEGDLMRGEAKLAKLAAEEQHQGDHHQRQQSLGSTAAGGGGGAASAAAGEIINENLIPDTETQKAASESLYLEPPRDKEEALERWKGFLRDRFIRGEDDEFDYSPVDKDDSFDVLERQDQEEEWFDEEEPNWASDGGGGDDDRGGIREERMLDGETGIQDF